MDDLETDGDDEDGGEETEGADGNIDGDERMPNRLKVKVIRISKRQIL